MTGRAYGSLRGGHAATQPLAMTYCLTEAAQQPPLGGGPPIVAADDCIDSLDFRPYISWLSHLTRADHRSRAFQITPSVALSLSLSPFSAAAQAAALCSVELRPWRIS